MAWDALLGEEIFDSMDRHCFRAIKIGLDQFHKYVILLSIAENLPTD